MPLYFPSISLLAPFDSVASFQALLMSAGRFLLTLAMSLFVSYLVFVIGSVLVSVVSRQVRVLTSRRPDGDPKLSRQGVAAGGRQPALVGAPAPGDVEAAPDPNPHLAQQHDPGPLRGRRPDNGASSRGGELLRDAELLRDGSPDAEEATP